MKDHRHYKLAEQLFTIFWRQSWSLHPGFDEVEPWEREAWLMVATFAKEGQTL